MDLKYINNSLNLLARQLAKQLQETPIEYIDLQHYADQVNGLKIKKQTLFLCDDDL